MADRYWVGNGANTAWTSTGNWSTTSGGSGGALAPTISDSVYFDGNYVHWNYEMQNASSYVLQFRGV